MGCDGGSIPTRVELVKEKKKPVQPDKLSLTVQKWFYCMLSKKPLAVPVVADGLGNLYNKEAILEMLVDRSSYGDSDVLCPHIRTLKDVTQLQLTANPNDATKVTSLSLLSQMSQVPTARFVCPITFKEMNGQYRFLFHRNCGWVVSEQALQQLGKDRSCLGCNVQSVNTEDFIPLNPEGKEKELLVEQMQIKLKNRKRGRKSAPAEEEERQRLKAPRVPSEATSILKEFKERKAAERQMSTKWRELFADGKKVAEGDNFLCRGTFTRYA